MENRDEPPGGERSLDEILEAVLNRPEDEWDMALSEACASHPEEEAGLRRRFEALRSFGLAGEPASASGGHPERIGAFTLLELIGSGGMGTVYRARHDDGREVALKLMGPGLRTSPSARERFNREGRALESLDHPAITQVLEAGEADGIPYLAMRFVPGESLAARLARDPELPSPEEVRVRVGIVKRVAEALAVLHEAGLLHRDIKPANIIVQEGGEPVLVDFGLVRDVNESASRLTQSGATLGSPSYLAPELVEGEAASVRSDIFALGVTLHECLTGELPFRGETRSALFRAITTWPAPDASLENSAVGRDLGAAAQTTLRKKPRKRYRNASDLARDLGAWLQGERVRAKRVGPVARVVGWVQRQPGRASAVVGLLLAAYWIPFVYGHFARGAERAEALALADAAADAEPELAVLLARRAATSFENPVTVGALHRAVANVHLRFQSPLLSAPIQSCAFLPDESRVVARTNRGELYVCTTEGQPIASLPGVRRFDGGRFEGELLVQRDGSGYRWNPDTGALTPLAQDGERLIDAHGIGDGDQATLQRLVVTADGALRVRGESLERELLPAASVEGLILEPSWGRVRSAFTWIALPDQVLVFNSDGSECGRTEKGELVALHPDGSAAVLRQADGLAWVRAQADGLRLVRRLGMGASAFAFSARSAGLAHLRERTEVRVYDATGELVATIPARGVFVDALAVDARGERLALGGGDGVVRLYHRDGSPAGELSPHGGHVTALAFGDDGEAILSGSYDRSVAWHWTRPGFDHVLRGSGAHVVDVEFDRGDSLWVDERGGLWRQDDERPVRLAEDVARMAALGGGRLVVGRTDGRIELLVEGESRTITELGSACRDLSADPAEGTRPGRALVAVVAGGATASRRVFRIESDQGASGVTRLAGDVVAPLSAHIVHAGSDLERTVVGAEDGRVSLWDRRGNKLFSWQAHLDWVRSVRFSPDGRLLATGSRDNTAAIWTAEGELVQRLDGHAGTVASVAFSADGERLASASTDGSLALWSKGGELVTYLRGHRGQVWDVAFDGRGRYLASGAFDGDVRVWPLETEELLRQSRALVLGDLPDSELKRVLAD